MSLTKTSRNRRVAGYGHDGCVGHIGDDMQLFKSGLGANVDEKVNREMKHVNVFYQGVKTVVDEGSQSLYTNCEPSSTTVFTP